MEINTTLSGPEWDAVFNKKRKIKTFCIHFVLKWWAKILPLKRNEYVNVKLQSPCFPTWEGVIIGRDRLGKKRHFMKWKSVKHIKTEE